MSSLPKPILAIPSVHNITLEPALPYPANSMAINKAGPKAV